MPDKNPETHIVAMELDADFVFLFRFISMSLYNVLHDHFSSGTTAKVQK